MQLLQLSECLVKSIDRLINRSIEKSINRTKLRSSEFSAHSCCSKPFKYFFSLVYFVHILFRFYIILLFV
jgi:hypothetical protein